MQTLQRPARVGAKTRMDPRSLQHCTSLRGEPTESSRQIQLPDRTAALYYLGKGAKMRFYFDGIQRVRERSQLRFVQGIDQLQKFQFRTIQHHPDIQELLPVHPGHDADDSVFK